MTNSVVKTWLRYQLAVKDRQHLNFKILKFRQPADCIPKIRQDIITRIKTWFEVFKGRQVTRQILPQNVLILDYQVNLRQTEALSKIFGQKSKPEMILFWELLNFLQRNMRLTSSHVQTNRLSPKITESTNCLHLYIAHLGSIFGFSGRLVCVALIIPLKIKVIQYLWIKDDSLQSIITTL